MNQQVKDFFLRYQDANAASDLDEFSRLYADTFLFGGPKGVQAVKKEDFLKVILRMKSHFSSLGLCDTQLQSVEARPLAPNFLLVEVSWRMKLQTQSGFQHLNTLATYVLEHATGESLRIVFQIDHQDLAVVVKEMQNTEE